MSVSVKRGSYEKFTPEEIGKITKYQEEHGLSKVALAEELGLVPGTLYRILEAGTARGKNAKKIKKFLSNGHPPKQQEKETNGSTSQEEAPDALLDQHAIFAAGRTTGWIQAYAEAIGASGRDLTQRVAALLSARSRWSPSRVGD